MYSIKTANQMITGRLGRLQELMIQARLDKEDAVSIASIKAEACQLLKECMETSHRTRKGAFLRLTPGIGAMMECVIMEDWDAVDRSVTRAYCRMLQYYAK